MEYVVLNCVNCGGWCCKGLNSSGVTRSYWKNLTPEQIVEINPWIPITMDLQKNTFCNCLHLNSDGLCDFYSYRDEACRNYPNLEFFFLEYLNGDASFYVPWCTYRSIILQSLNIPFEIKMTGEECRLKYLQKIRENQELAYNFHGKDILISHSYEINKTNSNG